MIFAYPPSLSCDDILGLLDAKLNEIKKDKNDITIKYHVEDRTEPFQASSSSTLGKLFGIVNFGQQEKKAIIVKKNRNRGHEYSGQCS